MASGRSTRVGVFPTAAGTCAIAVLALSAFSLIPTATPAVAKTSCPEASSLVRPQNPRGAIPAAKEALGVEGRVLEVKRGPRSTYAAAAKRACGVEVLRDSIYVVVHPVGMVCAACNLHAYVVKYSEGLWKVWTAY